MKIIHFSVRYSEGGAARVARAIHEKSLVNGVDSRFVYGYSKGVSDSIEAKFDDRSLRIGSKINVALNLISHKLIGLDLFKPTSACVKKLENELISADIIHIHVVHSYYVPMNYIFKLSKLFNKHVVITAHDYWWITGRCALPDGCDGWRSGCGSCKSKNNYPPASFDFSDKWLKLKRKFVNENKSKISLVSPSMHLAEKIKFQYPNNNVLIIPNSIDQEFQGIADNVEERGFIRPNKSRELLVVAADLSYGGKTNYGLVMACSRIEGVKIHCVGKNSPFKGAGFINHGEILDRRVIVDLYKSCDALIFSSEVDNYPLVLCEASYVGLPILATDSSAANEILNLFDARCLRIEELLAAVIDRNFLIGYKYQTRAELRAAAISIFTASAMFDAYLNLYRSICDN